MGSRSPAGITDGRIGEVDLKETITGDHRPIFNQLKDINLFKNFKVEFDTLIWPNELDIAPEYLYFQSVKDDSRLNNLKNAAISVSSQISIFSFH
jgi:hypothetical protein